MIELEKLMDEGSQWLPWLTEKSVSIVVGIIIFFIGKFIARKVADWLEARMLKSK